MTNLRILLFFLLFVAATNLHSQEKAGISFDQSGYLILGNYSLTFYLQPTIDFVTIDKALHQNVGLAGGVLINDRFTIGSYGSLLYNPHKFILIFPNNFDLNMIHGGLQLGYSLPIYGNISLGLESRLGIGEIIASYEGMGDGIYKTPIKVYQLGLGCDYRFFRFLKANVGVGYRQFGKVALSEIDQSDLSSLYASFSLKIGNFNK
jgi:hypothetical protein